MKTLLIKGTKANNYAKNANSSGELRQGTGWCKAKQVRDKNFANTRIVPC